MRTAEFPFWMRALLIVTLILLFGELVVLITPIPALLQKSSWKVDPGLATLIGAVLGLSIVGWQAKVGFNNLIRSQEHRAKIELDAVKFTKWHEKRVDSLIILFDAFSKYLDFLRKMFYFDNSPQNLDPMHDFRRTIEAQIVFLDDGMAEKISRYQGELLLFWNWAMRKKAQGESREEIRHRLDYEIPAYLSRLRRDINEFLDPNYQKVWSDPRLLIADQFLRNAQHDLVLPTEDLLGRKTGPAQAEPKLTTELPSRA